MYLLPTQKEMDALWRQINPMARIMDYLYSRPPAEGSMADSQTNCSNTTRD